MYHVFEYLLKAFWQKQDQKKDFCSLCDIHVFRHLCRENRIMMLLFHFSVGLDSCPEAHGTNMSGCEGETHSCPQYFKLFKASICYKQDQMWLWEDSSKRGWTVTMILSNSITIWPNRHYNDLYVYQIWNVLYKHDVNSYYMMHFVNSEKKPACYK